MVEGRTRNRIHAYSYYAAEQDIAGETCGALSAHGCADINTARLVAFLLGKSGELLFPTYFDGAR